VKGDWGGASRSDAVRASMVEQLYNRTMIENAQRAVNRKAPADFRRIKELWEEVVDNQPKQQAAEGQPKQDLKRQNQSRPQKPSGRD